MSELSAEGVAPDLGMLTDRIITAGNAQQVGGPEYLRELYASAYVRTNLGHYADRIREAAAARRALDALNAARDAILNHANICSAEAIAVASAALSRVATTTKVATRFQAATAAELLATRRKHDWVVRNLIERGTLTFVIGQPGKGKSLVATDIAMSVSAALHWNGRSTSPGGFVVLVIGEGQTGAVRRIAAWCARHQIAPDNMALAVIREAGDLADDATATALRDAIARAAEPYGGKPALIVVDTLARYFRGDENSATDTGKFIGNVDTYLREHFGSAVVVVHHAGWGENARGRGSSALHAAADLELLVERAPGDNKVLTVSCTKAKDLEPPEPMAFVIRPVELDYRDDDGRIVTSIVIDPAEMPKATKGARGLGKSQANALAALNKMMADAAARAHGNDEMDGVEAFPVEEWRDASGINRKRWPEARQGLIDRGLIEINGGNVRLAGRPK